MDFEVVVFIAPVSATDARKGQTKIRRHLKRVSDLSRREFNRSGFTVKHKIGVDKHSIRNPFRLKPDSND